MAQTPDPRIAYMEDGLAAPRKNGELVFEAPWEGRIFGMAVALSDRNAFEWEAFRQRLIAEIAAAEKACDGSSYYERWLRAFESMVFAHGMLSPAEIDARSHDYESGERDDD